MNDDLISRSALKIAIREATYDFTEIPIRADVVIALIDNSPSMGATEERSQGEWIKDESSSIAYRCSNCEVLQHWSPIKNDKYHFCPNCGAEMQKGGAE